jgi:hypothetical protein
MGQPSDGSWDVYLYDLETDEYLLATAGLGNGNSYAPSISEGGLAVAFQSEANDLVATGTSGFTDLFYSAAYERAGARSLETHLSGGYARGRPERGVAVRLHLGNAATSRSVLRINLIADDSNAHRHLSATRRISRPARTLRVGDGDVQIAGYRAPSPSDSSDGRCRIWQDTTVSIDGSNAGTLETFVRDRTPERRLTARARSLAAAARYGRDLAERPPLRSGC